MEDNKELDESLWGVVEQHASRIERLEDNVDRLDKTVTNLNKTLESLEENSSTIVTLVRGVVPWAKRVVGLLALLGASSLFNVPPEVLDKLITLLQKLG